MDEETPPSAISAHLLIEAIYNKSTSDRRFTFFGGDPLKFVVIGAVKRKGNVVARVIDRMNTPTLERFVNETVSTRVIVVSKEGILWMGNHLVARCVRNQTEAAFAFDGPPL